MRWTLLLPKLGDSLAGRMTILELHPLTAAEHARHPGGFLGAWLAGKLRPDFAAGAKLPAPLSIVSRVLAGGFPEPLTRTPVRARAWHRDYVRALVERDVQDVARIREPRDLTRLLALLALRTGELLNIATLSNELDLRRETVEHYLAVCERLYLVRRLQPWHYRDKDQVEVDLVITRGTRTWGVEVKASATPGQVDTAGLRRLAAQCGDDFAGGVLLHAGANTITLGDPRFLAVPLTRLWEI